MLVRVFSGAFGGFVPLKLLLQWLSASLSGRSLLYYSFSNPLAASIPAFVEQLQREFSTSNSSSAAAAGASSASGGVTVGEMWRALKIVSRKWSKACARGGSAAFADKHEQLFVELIKQIRDTRKG